MSFEAIYEVTRGLRMLLHSQLVQQNPSAVVTLLPPGDTLPDTLGVNLYLYRVIESPFTRNQDWPGDRVTPPGTEPALGLILSYLLTPIGKKPDDESATLGDDAHTMLGVSMLTLHEHPVLNDVHMPGFDADTVLPAFLQNSYDKIKITLIATSLEELSKIWATINKPYRLSVAYEVSLVQLTPPIPPPTRGGMVTSTGVRVITLDAPRLTSLTPTGGALVRIAGGLVTPNDLQINGFGFSFPGQMPVVRVGGQVVTIKTAPAPTDQMLSVTLPSNLDAGPEADVTVTLNGRTSMPLTFLVRPWLTSIQPVRTDLAGGSLKLALTGLGFTAPQAVRFDGPGGTTNVTTFDAGTTETQLSITIPGTLLNGIYQVRAVLNDTSATNARALEVIPRVDSPIGLSTTTVDGRSVHRLTINGARLNGTNIRLIIDGVTYQFAPDPANPGAGSNATQIVYTLGRLLDAGAHQITVNVDGHSSHTVSLEV